ncbi:hypothetical protein K438DRAFT_1824274 [Mycena galopus ATCC 62051]|nr:hypothetical protein K438DRAFT_1824274 [Mycena galopus ATCC 62051]
MYSRCGRRDDFELELWEECQEVRMRRRRANVEVKGRHRTRECGDSEPVAFKADVSTSPDLHAKHAMPTAEPPAREADRCVRPAEEGGVALLAEGVRSVEGCRPSW